MVLLKNFEVFNQLIVHKIYNYLPSPFLTMLLSSTFSPSSIVLPDLTRVANNSVPGNRRNSPISLKNSCPPPTYIVGDLCSTLQLYKK